MQKVAAVFKLWFVGQPLIVGNSLSDTATVKVHVAAGVQALDAVTVTVVLPLLKLDPLPVPLSEETVAPINA